MSSFEERLADIQSRVASARNRAGRSDTIELMAVSKGQTASAIRSLYAAGQRSFGENYAQELANKARELEDLEEAAFHFIGHLQKNKIKDVVGKVRSIQTVDSEALATAIDRRLTRLMDVLIEVNIDGEPQKAGAPIAAVPALAEVITALPQLRLTGLMTVPPAAEEAGHARLHFRRLRELGEDLLRRGLLQHGLVLSMGMSQDFEVAIEEGATIVRVGTALFGPRAPRGSV